MFTPAGQLCPLTILNSTLIQSYLFIHPSWSLLLSKYIPCPYKTTCNQALEVLSSGDVMTHQLRPAAVGFAEILALQWSLWSAKVNTDVRQHGNVSLMEAQKKRKKKEKQNKQAPTNRPKLLLLKASNGFSPIWPQCCCRWSTGSSEVKSELNRYKTPFLLFHASCATCMSDAFQQHI